MKQIMLLSVLLMVSFSGCTSESDDMYTGEEKKEFTIINGEKVEVVYLEGVKIDDSNDVKNDEETGDNGISLKCNESTRGSKQFLYNWWTTNGMIIKVAIQYNKTRGQTITWSPYSITPPQSSGNQVHWVKRTYLEHNHKTPCGRTSYNISTTATNVNMSNYTVVARTSANASGLATYYVSLRLQASVNGVVTNSPLMVLRP